MDALNAAPDQNPFAFYLQGGLSHRLDAHDSNVVQLSHDESAINYPNRALKLALVQLNPSNPPSNLLFILGYRPRTVRFFEKR